MDEIKIESNVLEILKKQYILQRLIDSNRSLDSIQNELKIYLERKREKFGRFYFLSNDDLIQILSLTKEP